MKKEKISVKLTPTGTAYVDCPQCGESLFWEDLEEFCRCPYCDYAFDQESAELDDFIIMAKVAGAWRSGNRASAAPRS